MPYISVSEDSDERIKLGVESAKCLTYFMDSLKGC